MADYLLRSLARDDLEAIWDYTAENWGLNQAERYLEQIFQAFTDISDNPKIGKVRDDVKIGYRSFPQGRHVIFYKDVDDRIEIIGVVHQSADVDRHTGLIADT